MAFPSRLDDRVEPLLTVPEVAEWLHVSRAWVYSHASALGAVRIAGLRFRRDLVSAYVEAQSCPAPPTASIAEQAPPSGRRAGRTPQVSPTENPRAAEIAAKLRRGLRLARSNGSGSKLASQ